MLGFEEHDDDEQYSRAFAGAMLLAETLHDVRQIKRLLSKE